MDKKIKSKFEGLLIRNTSDNHAIIYDALSKPFNKQHETDIQADIHSVKQSIVFNEAKLIKGLVHEFYENVSKYETLFSPKKYKKELEKLGELVTKEIVDVVKSEFERKANENWIIRPHQKEAIVGENLNEIVFFTETFAKSQVFIETLTLETKLQSYFQNTDYKSLTLNKLSFAISVIALILAGLSYFK